VIVAWRADFGPFVASLLYDSESNGYPDAGIRGTTDKTRIFPIF
jgi:hypothetical protein